MREAELFDFQFGDLSLPHIGKVYLQAIFTTVLCPVINKRAPRNFNPTSYTTVYFVIPFYKLLLASNDSAAYI
jgi:hypothetical protein